MIKIWELLNKGGWILLVVALVAGWVWREIGNAERRGAAEVLAAQSDSSWSALLDSVNGSWRARDILSRARTDSLTRELEIAGGRILAADERASEARNEASRVLRRMARRDSVGAAQIEAALATADSANVACKSGLNTCEALTDSLRLDLTDIRGRLESTLALNADQSNTIDELRAVGVPSKGPGLLGWGGWLAAAVGFLVAVIK